MARQAIPGNAEFHFLETAPGSMTGIAVATEIGAGDTTALLGTADEEALFAHSGWTPNSSTTDVPDYLSLKTGNIEGRTTYQVGMFQFYWDEASHPIYTAMTEGLTGTVVVSPSGATSGNSYTAYPAAKILVRAFDENEAVQTYSLMIAYGTPVDGTFVV